MSHKNALRKDKTCLNCHYVVQERYCTNCGQENTDTRKTFHHLFIHFFEDLTHYENAFWKTIKNLLLKPGDLTKQYLSGKRMSYLAPVRLYIFISFATFFIIGILPNDEKKEPKKTHKKEVAHKKNLKDTLSEYEKEIIELKNEKVIDAKIADSLIKKIKNADKFEETEKRGNSNFTPFVGDYKSISELDSLRKANPNEMGSINYWFQKKAVKIKEKYTKKEIKEKFLEGMKHNFPKTLFFYMPTFAFLLWLFHNKKRWYYFDHGIFTLHYFSFLLLIVLLIELNSFIFGFFDNWFTNTIRFIFGLISIIWMFYYFFPAHHRFYGGSRTKTVFLGIAFLFINLIFIIFGTAIFAIISFLSIH